MNQGIIPLIKALFTVCKILYFHHIFSIFLGLLAICIPQLDNFIALVGSVCGATVGMILPPLLHFTYNWDRGLSKYQLGLDIFLLLLGIFACITGTFSTLYAIFHRFVHHPNATKSLLSWNILPRRHTHTDRQRAHAHTRARALTHNMHKQTCTHTHTYARAHAMRARTHARTHTRAHAHARARTHIQKQISNAEYVLYGEIKLFHLKEFLLIRGNFNFYKEKNNIDSIIW